jgi:hypothetical protein
MTMGERRFRLSVQTGCITQCEAMGVMVKGEDARWRYWIELDGRCIPGEDAFPPTREGHARLKRRASGQLWARVFPPPRAGVPEDVQ